LNNIKANKKTLQVADEFIKQNGGYQKFNETFKEKTRASASIQPSRPATTIPTKPCISQVQVQPSTQTPNSSISDTKNLPTEKTADKSIDFKWPFFKTNQATKKKISKLEIGAPVNFQVVSHIGLDHISTMKTMMDSGSNSSLNEILEFLKLNKIKPNKKALQVADEFIKQNGGYQKFNETFKEKTRASASIQPSRPAPTIPTKTMHKSGSISAIDTNFKFFIEQRLPFMGNFLFYKTRVSVINIKFVFK